MNEAHDKAWMELAKRVREGKRHVVSGEEAERLLHSLPDECISQAEEDALVAAVLAGRATRQTRRDMLIDETKEPARESKTHVEEDVLQLNRNKGGEDKDAEKLLEELRRQALEDENGDETERNGDGVEPRD